MYLEPGLAPTNGNGLMSGAGGATSSDPSEDDSLFVSIACYLNIQMGIRRELMYFKIDHRSDQQASQKCSVYKADSYFQL